MRRRSRLDIMDTSIEISELILAFEQKRSTHA